MQSFKVEKDGAIILQLLKGKDSRILKDHIKICDYACVHLIAQVKHIKVNPWNASLGQSMITNPSIVRIRNHGGRAIKAAAAAGALLEVGQPEGCRQRADIEIDLVATPHHLIDPKPQKEDLDADASKVGQRPRGHRAGDLSLVVQQVAAGDLELAVAAQIHLEAPILIQNVAPHALREDPSGEIVLLQHLVGGRLVGDLGLNR